MVAVRPPTPFTSPSWSDMVTVVRDMEPLRALAARQHGLFTRSQAREAGFDRKALRRRVRDGYLTFLTPRVLRIGGAADSEWQTSMAGVLDVGLDAVASHLTAASLWGVPHLPRSPIDVSIERVARRNLAAVKVHHLTVIPPDQRVLVHDIPVTAPPLTVLLIAGRDGPDRAAQVLDHFLANGDTDVEEVDGVVSRLSKQGRDGLRPVRKLLNDRADHQAPAESNNERRFLYLAREAGFTALERQVNVGIAHWIGRVDFMERALRLIIEIHSERYHTSWANRRADAERIARLQDEGYTVLVVWDHEIWYERDVVVDRLMRTRHELLRRQA